MLSRTLLIIIILNSNLLFPQSNVFKYPESKIQIVNDTIHGVVISDPYRWLEDGKSSETINWVTKQNELTRSILDTLRMRKKIEEQLIKLYNLTTYSSPGIYGKRYFFFKRSAGQNHSVLYVREGNYKSPPREVLNPNNFSDDGTIALDWYYPSPGGSLIAYGKSESGSEVSTLFIRDVKSGKDLDLQIPRTRSASVAWVKDGKGFYYTRYPKLGEVEPGDEKYYRRIYFHKLGENPDNDKIIFGENIKKEEWCNVYTSSDEKYLIVKKSSGWVKDDVYIRELEKDETFTTIAESLDAQFICDVYKNTIYMLTNFRAPRYKIISIEIKNPSRDNSRNFYLELRDRWKDLITEQNRVIENFSIIGGKLVITISENVISHLCIYSLDGKKEKEIQLPTLGTVSGVSGVPDGNELFFTFTSFFYPPTVYRYDMKTGKLEITDKMVVDFDLSKYEVKQVFYESKDKTKVPMFIVNKKGIKLDGNNPTLIYGYGGFNISINPSFQRNLYVWLVRGGVYAVASIRGGGEYGSNWHDSGKLDKKQNVFDDFIAGAEWLIKNKYTNPNKLAIEGGSNGGLLVGAVMIQRPELFKGVICSVPLIDMIRYHKFLIARLWIPEYGSSENSEQFKWLYSYSPYHNVKDGIKYPATLIITAESDTRVDPLHARKMTALLQKANSGENPILLRVETKAGHGAGKPISKIIGAEVDKWTFLMWQLKMKN